MVRSPATCPPARRGALIAALALLPLGVAAAPAGAFAQPAGCAVPKVPAAAPAPATPAAMAATPAAAATPVAAGEDAPADALSAELEAVSRALAACLTAGDAALVADLATERYLGQLFGSPEPLPAEQYLALAPELDDVPVRIVALEDARRVRGTATAVVTSVLGNQLTRGTWSFVEAPEADRARGESRWRVDAEARLDAPAPRGASTLDVAISDGAIALSGTQPARRDVVLTGSNAAADDHELLVLRFDRGAGVETLLRGAGPGLPEGVAWVGQATAPAGGEAELVLVDLEPGEYAVVCLLTDANGTPHAALGEVASFTVK